MKKILDIIKKLFGNKELVGKAVEVAPVVIVKPVAPKKKPKKKKKNEPK